MDQFEIIDGVRRAKAAELAGHSHIRSAILSQDGRIIEERDIPIDTLRSPKTAIRRIIPPDERRWKRVIAGATQPALPFPPLLVQPGSRGTRISDVNFDFGNDP